MKPHDHHVLLLFLLGPSLQNRDDDRHYDDDCELALLHSLVSENIYTRKIQKFCFKSFDYSISFLSLFSEINERCSSHSNIGIEKGFLCFIAMPLKSTAPFLWSTLRNRRELSFLNLPAWLPAWKSVYKTKNEQQCCDMWLHVYCMHYFLAWPLP